MCPALQGVAYRTYVRSSLHLLCLPTWVWGVQDGQTLGDEDSQVSFHAFFLLEVNGKCIGKPLLERVNARELVMGNCQPNIQGELGVAEDGLRHGERTFRKAGGTSQDTGGNMKAWLSSSSWRLEKEEDSQLDMSDVLQA